MAFDHRQQQFLLAPEMGVNGTSGISGGVGDVLQSGAAEAVTMEAKAYSLMFPDWKPADFRYWRPTTAS
jgi:hypothetical protein